MKKAFVLFALATTSVFAAETAATTTKPIDQKKSIASAEEQTKSIPQTAKTEGGVLFVAGMTNTCPAPTDKDEQPSADKKADQKAAPQTTAKTPAPKVAIA